LRFHDPHDPRAYNIFQKLSYAGVIFVLLPLLIASGLAISPNMWPWLAGPVRRAPVGALGALHRDGADLVLYRRALDAGDPRRPDQRGAFDDHRLVARARGSFVITRRNLARRHRRPARRLRFADRQIRWLLSAEDAHRFLQRSINGRAALAREFRAEQRSPIFRVNGTANPNTPEYNALAANRFADWRLTVDGLVARPLSPQPRPAPVDAAARADHPARLRRGLERDRQMAGAAARDRAPARRHARHRALHRLPLRRSLRRHALITNRSTWSTPSIPRRSSPGR
jgi:hypothetical protein